MARLRPVLSILMVGLASTVACGPAAQRRKLTEKYQPAIERHLAALPDIAAQVRQIPPLEEDRIDPEAHLVVDWQTDRGINTSVCHAEDLADPDELGYVPVRLSDSGELNQCASLLHRGHRAYDPARRGEPLHTLNLNEAQWNFPKCADVRYLLVIRTLEFVAPTTPKPATRTFEPIIERDGQDVAEEFTIDPRLDTYQTYFTFAGGLFHADVLAFDLDTRKLLGGTRVSIESSRRIQGEEGAVADDFKHKIVEAFRKAVNLALAGRAP